ncbi:Diacetylchitobiose binding protein DasA [Baekduia alba]|uniref:ABC transporter substrate-binding protein n=1 Tax=Baekduia alba TaxID=2997333 RepID=UPI0023421CBD|nr:sugar ABC transporter substrate-binding protein [Baekduia alba]WCB93416.1 Diacetylchitobiose binding protein DasA [Baekduia alba]
MRRRALAVALMAVMSIAVAACGGSSGGDESAAKGPVKLRFLSLAWQKESISANKEIVAAWNKSHPNIQVQYVQGDWDSVHDRLVTAFAGDKAPDVFQYSSDSLGDFVRQGYIAKLDDRLSASMKSEIRPDAWKTVQYQGGTYAVPFLQESQIIVANRKLLKKAGIAVPTPDQPWTWDQFQAAAKTLTTGGTHGVAWALKQSTNRVLNLSLSFDGKFFGSDGKSVSFDAADQQVPKRIHDMLYTDASAAKDALGMGTADPLPAFFAGKYAMVPAGVWFRQQVQQQAPKGFDWVTLPPLKGANQDQGAVSQTLSVTQQSDHQDQATQFIEYFLNAKNMAQLAKGDWLLPTSDAASAELEKLTGGKDGWDVALASGKDLVLAPFQQVPGYAEWKDKIADPAFQEYFADRISLDQLGKKLVDDGNPILQSAAR